MCRHPYAHRGIFFGKTYEFFIFRNPYAQRRNIQGQTYAKSLSVSGLTARHKERGVRSAMFRRHQAACSAVLELGQHRTRNRERNWRGV